MNGYFFMQFFKMQNLGNDFVFTFNNLVISEISKICDRNFGIGADGVVQIYLEGNKYGYNVYNKDGSMASFCGSATLCLGKYLHDSKLVGKNFEIVTPSGIKQVSVNGNGTRKKITINIGKVAFQQGCLKQGIFNRLLFLKNGEKTIRVRASLVSVGNLHLVIKGDYSKGEQLEIVNGVNNSGLFLNGVNIEFANKRSGGIFIDVYERGVGKTLCCTSGACAVFGLFNKLGYAKNKEKIIFDNGSMVAEMIDDEIYITSFPTFVYSGVWGKNEY